MNLPFFLARRIYTNNSDKTRVDRPAIRIAIAGVAIGLAVMLVSVSVVFGFKHTIRDKVVGFGSHIQVANFMALQTAEQYPIQMGDSMLNVLKRIPGVSHVQRYAIKQGILKTETDFLGVYPRKPCRGYYSEVFRHAGNTTNTYFKDYCRPTESASGQQSFCLFYRYQRCTHAPIYRCRNLSN